MMAQGCVPLFLDVDQLPPQTLAHYPRRLLSAALRLAGVRIAPPPGAAAEWYLHPASFTLPK